MSTPVSSFTSRTAVSVTELAYRHQIRPVIEQGAETMDDIFDEGDDDAAA